MSLPTFIALTVMYILAFGVLAGGFAAWAARGGSSPFRHFTSAFRPHADSPAGRG